MRVRSFLIGLVLGLLVSAGAVLLHHQWRRPASVTPGYLRISRHVAFMDRISHGPASLVLLGDSITDFWRDVPELFAETFPPGTENFGVGYDRIADVRWRIDHGELSGHPRQIVVLIGANDIPVMPPKEVAAGINGLLAEVRKVSPDSRVILMALLPQLDDEMRERVRVVNQLIRPAPDDPFVRWLDIGPQLLTDDGRFRDDLMPDRLHLSPAGYRVWADAIKPMLNP
jgi:lysophospholipase L1-like esterase